MNPTSSIKKPPAYTPDLAPRLAKALDAAKTMANRRIPAVPVDTLTETYRREAPTDQQMPPNTQLQLAVDDSTGRVIGRIVDIDSGKIISQVPSEDMLRLIAKTKELFGPLVNETV